MFARSGNREAFFVQEALDLQNGFNVFPAIEAMAARAFDRLQGWKLGFPETEHERLGFGEAAYLTDAEKTLLRNFRRGLSGTCHVFSVS